MADKNLMAPSTTSLSGLLGNGITYKVPIFQRDYSWKIDNWIDLWEDIRILLNTGKDHYMGAVVLQKSGEKDILPFLKEALHLFGPKRCIVGSNCPPDRVHMSFDEIFRLLKTALSSYSDTEQQKVFYGNEKRLYQL